MTWTASEAYQVASFYISNLFLLKITDIDECQNNNGGCSHKCTNKPGSYSCSCKPGYELKADKHGCKGKYMLYIGLCILAGVSCTY